MKKGSLSWWSTVITIIAGLIAVITFFYGCLKTPPSAQNLFNNSGVGNQVINQWPIARQNIIGQIVMENSSQIYPMIEVQPTHIEQFPGTTQTKINFKIINVGSTDAFHVVFDAKYGNGFWTSEWVKAHHQTLKGPGDIKGQLFSMEPEDDIPKLRPGESKDITIINAMDLESEVCKAGNEGFPIQIRESWQSQNKQSYERIFQHKILCTRDTQGERLGRGRAFSFFPDKLISQSPSISNMK